MHSASKWIISDARSIPEEESCWILLNLSRAQNMTRKSMACIMLATQNRQWIQIFGSVHEIILSLLTSLDCGFIILTLRSLRQDRFCFFQMCFSRSCQLNVFRMSHLLFVGQTTELTDSSFPCGLSVSNVLNSSVYNV